MAEPLVDFTQVGPVTVATFTRDQIFEEEEIQVIGEELLRRVSQAQLPRLVLNFCAVIRMSSHMVGELIKAHKNITAAGGRLVLCDLRPQLREMFRFLRLDEMFPVYSSEEEAVQSFGA